ncbi:MAG: nitronate monooxygenase [Bryobacterales bacterium]|nr:nitronate monooxygenase [Bryobacterales bacterium]
MSHHPTIIQGGMGAGVSHWRLANSVSRLGQLGVVSGTALDQILVRRLQDGDPGGHMRRALDHFPFPEMAARVRQAWFLEGGKAPSAAYKSPPMHAKDSPRHLKELTVIANFVEIWLAKEGHANPVGINYLEKAQLPHLPSIYGAMIAGVDYVLMGAGIPIRIPGVLDAFAQHQTATYPLHVAGTGDPVLMEFNPAEYMERPLAPLQRPKFLPIIASNTLAVTLLRKSNGAVDGFVVEGPTAGGHNAPPRGKLQLSDQGEPIYGERDEVDLAKLRELGVPFWLAGGYGAADKLQEALAAGAAGIQVGTPFAFCTETGLSPYYREAVLKQVASGNACVFTDPIASPTNFPFKVVQIEDSVAHPDTYAARTRVCDLGVLREPYFTEDGKINYRCAAEPVATHEAKGGKAENTEGRKCLCNALLANIGLPQVRNGGYVERGLITAGNSLTGVAAFLPETGLDYTAADVINKILACAS